MRLRISNVELGRFASAEIRPLMRTEFIKLRRAVIYKINGQSPRGQREESAPALVVRLGSDTETGSPFSRDSNIGIVKNEAPIETFKMLRRGT